MRVAIAKMLVDYGAMYLTWSLYTIGFFVVDQGEFSTSPLEIFPHVSMISFYLSVYLGYAFSFTLLEALLRQIYLFIPRRFDALSGLLRSSELTKALGAVGSMLLLPAGLSLLLPLWFALGQASVQITHPMAVWQQATTVPVATWAPSPPPNPQESCSVECLNTLVKNHLHQAANQLSRGK
jgi:hypothetical protein